MKFDYCQPSSITEVLKILSGGGEGIKILAGGTDLLVNLQEGLLFPRLLVDIGSLKELQIMEEKDSRVSLGALVTHARAAESDLLRKKVLPLAQSCAEIGSPQIRCRGTIGGNLVNASPAADSLPPLFVLGAGLNLKSLKGERTVPIEEFFTGVKKSVIRPDELLTEISFPSPGETGRGFFKKLGQRKALAIAKVSVAAWIDLEGERVSSARIALGAVATTVIRARRTEAYLKGKVLDQEVIAAASWMVQEESKAISDIRSTADYRDEMAGVLLSRGLNEIAGQT